MRPVIVRFYPPQGMLDAAWSKDGDIPCHGVEVTLRGNIDDVYEWNGDAIDEYTTGEFLGDLSLTLDQFIDLCYLLGNDYCKGGLPGLGPKGALDAIKDTTTYPNMRAIWESHPKRPKPLAEVSIDASMREALLLLVADADQTPIIRAVLLAQLATTMSADLELDGAVRGTLLTTLAHLPTRAALVKLLSGAPHNRDSSSSLGVKLERARKRYSFFRRAKALLALRALPPHKTSARLPLAARESVRCLLRCMSPSLREAESRRALARMRTDDRWGFGGKKCNTEAGKSRRASGC
jgi:hypothetical protein